MQELAAGTGLVWVDVGKSNRGDDFGVSPNIQDWSFMLRKCGLTHGHLGSVLMVHSNKTPENRKGIGA